MDQFGAVALQVARNAAPGLVLLVVCFSSRSKLINGLQVLIAKGRKNKNRSALVGNFAGVKEELHEQDLQVVEGSIPADLRGAYMRNGSNPYYEPYASYHWFEGDGMIHAVLIKDGDSPDKPKLSYCNRFMDTSRLRQEKKAGKPIFAKFGDQEGRRGLLVVLLEQLKNKLGITDVSQGDGTANTSIVYHAKKIMALHEGDLPYQVRILCDGLLETVGRMQISKEWAANFTAHPKHDAATGNLHFIGYKVDKPEVNLGTLSPKGDLSYSLKVKLPYPAMMHDMAITPKYKVLLHMPLVFAPENMVKNNSLPLVYKSELPSRIGLAPHGATSDSEVQWFELPSFMCFHVANAWEEEDGNVVKLYLCSMRKFDMAATVYHDDHGSRMSEVVMDTRTGKATFRQMTQVVGDFPLVHPEKNGVKTRYAWVATTDTSDPQARTDGIAKFDLLAGADKEEACVGRIHYPKACHGGEAYFVPRKGADASSDDDGYLLVYVYNSTEDTSYFEVYDAKTMGAKPVASVRLPQRVPFGFHGTFVTKAQLDAAKTVTA